MRRLNDFYETPTWCIEALLKVIPKGRFDFALDPCCGTGNILDALKKWDPNLVLQGFEIDPSKSYIANKKHTVTTRDALDAGCWGRLTELVITNPPYKSAMQFVEKSIRNTHTTCMLLPLNFLGSQKRAKFHRENPSDIYILPKRPSFTGTGTDACEYAWFVWGTFEKGIGNRWRILDL